MFEVLSVCCTVTLTGLLFQALLGRIKNRMKYTNMKDRKELKTKRAGYERDTSTHAGCQSYGNVVVNFLSQVIFVFPLFQLR